MSVARQARLNNNAVFVHDLNACSDISEILTYPRQLARYLGDAVQYEPAGLVLSVVVRGSLRVTGGVPLRSACLPRG